MASCGHIGWTECSELEGSRRWAVCWYLRDWFDCINGSGDLSPGKTMNPTKSTKVEETGSGRND
jgi:hypothetical protein